MRVPLTTRDFLDRAELVYGDRVGDRRRARPARPPAGRRDLPRGGPRGPGPCRPALDELGVGEGERVAVVSHNSARLLELLLGVPSSGRVLVPVNFRLAPEEVSYIVGHSGARVLLVDPELEPAAQAGSRPSTGSCIGRGVRAAAAVRRRAARRGPSPTRTPPPRSTTPAGTTARPKGVQMTHRNIWVNAVTFGMHMQVSDRDVYLHTLPMFHCNGWGMPYAMAGLGVPQVVHPQGRRRRDPAPGRAARRHADVRRAGRVERRARRRGRTGTARSPAATGCGSSSPARRRPSRTIARVETELGWEFNQIYGLTETVAAAHHQPRRAPSDDDLDAEERAQRLSRAGVPALGARLRVSDTGEVLARGQRRAGRLLGEPGRHRRGAGRTAGSTPATAARSTTAATSRSPTARRT